MKTAVVLILGLFQFVNAQNSLNNIIQDMRFPHEGYPHGVPDSFTWYWGPRLGTTICPAGWTAMIGWGQVYEWAKGNPASNTRVHLKNMETWYLSGADHQWHPLQNDIKVFGMAYVEDFSGNTSKAADCRAEADGGISVKAGNGYNFHFWPNSGRAVLPKVPITGWFVTVQARLILDNAAGVDDREQARYLLNVGADWWESITAVWDNFKTNTDIGIGRFKFVKPEWQAFNFITIPYTTIHKNPPPFQGDHTLDPDLLVHENLLVNGDFSNGRDRWFLEIHDGCAASWQYQNNELYIRISQLASDSNYHPYRVQVKQFVSILKPETEYRLTFKSKGTIPWLKASIGKNELDWSVAGLDQTINLSRNWSATVIDFKTGPDIIANNKFYFQLGSQTGEVWIDDIVLIEKSYPSHISARQNSPVVPYQLGQNYPNPANPTTKIRYSLMNSQTIDLSVFNMEGKKVKTLAHGYQNAGEYTLVWDGRDSNQQILATGIYFYRLSTDFFSTTRKILLVR